MKYAFIWHYAGGVMFPCKTEAETRGRLVRAWNAHKSFIRKHYRLDFRVRRSQSEGIAVEVAPVILNGIHYRGLAVNRKKIVLHCGLIDGKWYDLFPKPLGTGQILTHENLHCLGLGHTNDPADVMHPFTAPGLTATLPYLLKLFGRIKPNAKKKTTERETAVEYPTTKLRPCYVGQIDV